MKPKALVTGSNGFIGYNLCRKLTELRWPIECIDDLSTGSNFYFLPNVKYHIFNLVDSTRTAEVMANFKPDVVFHLAALPRIKYSIDNPYKCCKANVLATVSILEAMVKHSPDTKLVFASSSSVYGANSPPYRENMEPLPQSPYAMAKYHCEHWIEMFSKLFGITAIVLRYFNVFGPYMRYDPDYSTVLIAWLYHQCVSEKSPAFIEGTGHQSRDFTFISDVVEGTIQAANAKLKGYEVFNIGSGQWRMLLDCKKSIEKLTGRKLKLEKRPWRKNDAFITVANISKAKKLLGYCPDTDFNAQLRKTMNWLKGE